MKRLGSFKNPRWRSVLSVALGLSAAVVAFIQSDLVRSGNVEEEEDFVRTRAEWFYQQRAFGLGYIPAGAREAALEKMDREMPAHSLSKRGGAAAWNLLGPANIAGRVTSIAIDPRNPSLMFFAAADGGVWKSTNGGSSWNPISDHLETLASGVIAFDGKNRILYYATGEAHNSLDSYGGTGVFKSTNEGATWAKLESVPTISVPNQTGPTYYFSSVFEIDTVKDRLWLGFLTRRQGSATANGALYKSSNRGNSWTRINQNGGPLQFPFLSDFVFDPIKTDTAYAAVGYAFGSLTAINSDFSEQGIYKTTDGGNNWISLSNGLPPPAEMGRINLAIAPSNPAVLYASIIVPTSNANGGGTLRGLYKTTNDGSTWTQLTSIPNYVGQQGFYNNVLVVHPTDPNTVFAGGIDIYRSTDGGTTWTNVTDFYNPSGPKAAGHPDQHAFVFHPTNSSTMYSGSDGGVFASSTLGLSWVNVNNGVSTTQFYSLALNPNDRNKLHGGTQDNGTVKFTGTPNWSIILGGDGGKVAVDFLAPETLYTVYVYLELYRSFNGGRNFSRITQGINLNRTTERIAFYAPYDVSQSQPSILYAGTHRMWKSTNRGSSWTVNSGDLTYGTGVLSAIRIAPSDPSHVYVGASDGRIWSTSDGGTKWDSAAVHPLGAPRRFVTDFAVHPTDPRIAFVTFSGYNTDHVFMTTDHGTTWKSISSGLPDIPVNSIKLHPTSPSKTIFLATDIGCMVSTNGGTSWAALGTGLPNVVVHEVAIEKNGEYLRAATHGRSVWELAEVPRDSGGGTPGGVVASFALLQNYPNPFNPGTTIRFELPRPERVTLKVYDITGREIVTLIDGTISAGRHASQWNGHDAARRPVASGIYVYRLEAGSFSESKKMILLR